MNSRHEATRVLPNHPAIAGNMQQIEVETAREPRKLDLMPENVFYWGPNFFGNRDQSHVVAGEIEEIEVVFQDEESELVLVGVGQKSFGEREDVLSDARFAVLDDRGGEADFHSRAFRSLKEGN